MGIISLLFGKKSAKPDFAELISQGAIIIDVRTAAEYKSGHIAKSKNISLQDLPQKMSSLKKEIPVITCCASGMRSASAASLLKKAGFNVHNGGGWYGLKNKI